MTIPCNQLEKIGKFEEFMDNTKGLKATLFIVAMAIAVQVGTFLYLWGGLTNTVQTHQKDIDKILTKLDTISFVYAQGEKGEQGIAGKDGLNR